MVEPIVRDDVGVVEEAFGGVRRSELWPNRVRRQSQQRCLQPL
jgi:hypothetical protein